MKQFNLTEYLENPELKVVTREGKRVRIVCTDAMSEYPIVALVRQCENTENICNFTKDGKHLKCVESSCDLFFAPTKHDGWANIYRINNVTETGTIYATKEEALVNALGTNYIDTVHIEWRDSNGKQ